MPQLRNTAPRSLAGLVAATTAVLFSVAGCGGGSGTPTTGDAGPGGNAGAFAEYTACLARNGVTVTMPSGGPQIRPSVPASGLPRPSGSARPGFPGGGFGRPEGVDDATWQRAQQACATILPSGRPGGGMSGRPDGGPSGRPGGGEPGGGMSAAYRNCLRDNGVTLDPGDPATDDPAVRKAAETCRVLAPAPSATP